MASEPVPVLGAGVGAGDGAGDGAGAGDGDGVGAGADAVTLGDVGVEPPPHCAEVSVTTPSANAMSKRFVVMPPDHSRVGSAMQGNATAGRRVKSACDAKCKIQDANTLLVGAARRKLQHVVLCDVHFHRAVLSRAVEVHDVIIPLTR